ncbi:MAG: glutamine-hydrolyzing carbamoyl-phosphate synthase small subunit [Rickettsiales bacterium]|jgi:carbamoyl-phosphate synthase small subunit|nr:glutamine-hydrolyzing carbamoyl-phosphate synthase small subunit [Rickettsiales bacterium]
MTEPFVTPPNAALVLADGSVFSGYGIGKEGSTSGEICFNTSMTGYQEILTDPSYTGQLICFTFPHVGNVGCNVEDLESTVEKQETSGASGLILREAITEPSNFRATAHLNDWLKRRGITGISGIDTRALTRHIRTSGAQNCAIGFVAQGAWQLAREKAEKALSQAPDMNGLELSAHVTTKENYEWNTPRWSLTPALHAPPATHHPLHVVAVDYGIKLNILRSLTSAGCRVTIVPATATAEEILAHKPDGVFLSNGPGDPAATGSYAVPVIKKIIATDIPVFGICLGHQMLGIALGCRTEKMRQGHRGANHPVKDLATGKVEITSQNHGFAISDAGLPPEVLVTHRSLFDGTIQGIAVKGKPIFSVQGHPEASPGPQDSQYLFAQFVGMIQQQKRAA